MLNRDSRFPLEPTMHKTSARRALGLSMLTVLAAMLCIELGLTDGLVAQTEKTPTQKSVNQAGKSIAPKTTGKAKATDPTEEDTADEEKKAAIPRNFEEIVDALGYFFVVPFVVASVISMWFLIERLVVLRRGRVLPRHFVDRFLEHLRQRKLDARRAQTLCQENGSPVAAVFAHGIRKWGKPSVEVEQAIIDGGERQVSQLRKHLRVINGVATVTPLIGLLGTVIGMIQAFNEIANTNSMGKAQELAAGIALALLTTAAGLLIAIPSLIMYMYLSGRVDSLVMEMDHLAQDVVQLISAEDIAQQNASARAVRKTTGTESRKPVKTDA